MPRATDADQSPGNARGAGREPVLKGLSSATLQRIFELASPVSCRAGEVLFIQDEPGSALYMLAGGSIEISVTGIGGKKLRLNIMKPGEVFGEIAVLDGGTRTATATALEDSTLKSVKRRAVLELIRTNPDIAVELISMLCARVRWVSQQVEDFGLLGVQKRLASRLSILCERFSDSSGRLHIRQNELADFLGASRESTNRVLQDWRQQGIIELSRGTLRLLDEGHLSRIASEDE